MTLANIFFPAGVPADLKAYGIVMSEAQRNTLIAKQDAAGLTLHRISPVTLTDGSYAVSADVLSETNPGGLFSRTDLIDTGNLDGVTVESWGDVLSLLPEAEETAAKTGVTL